MYSQDLIEAVLKHCDIVTVISAYLTVIKKGRNYVALCPFHDDKNPSMQISAEKQIYKCFACGAGGNAITFVRDHEKISFAAAVRKVAQICGYNDPRLVEDAPRVKKDPEIGKLEDCINELQNYYRYGLSIPEAEEARNYLDSRGLGPEVQAKYGIGYAPMDGRKTIKFLQAKGFSLKNIDDIGIALVRGEGTSDSSAGRVTFPVHNPYGQVIGFSARRIRDDGTAKYVYSRDSRLSKKGDVIYNYHNVATSAHHDGYCYVLEGFMDVMALDRAGIPNAVALMGTALTKDQINLLKRLRCEIRLCLDGDGPGQAAMMKAIPALTRAGIKFRLVDYGNDTRDPDDILREEGAEALKAKVNRLVEAVDFQLGYYLNNKKLESAEDRQKVLRAFIPTLRSKPPGIEYEDMLVKLATATGYNAEAIRELARQTSVEDDVEAIERVQLRMDPTSGQAVRRVISRMELAERTMIHYMLQSREAIDFFEKNVGSFTTETLYPTIAEFLLEFKDNHPGDPNLSGVLAYIEGSGIDNADAVEAAVSDVALDESLPPLSERALGDCATVIRDESLAIHQRMTAKRVIETGSLESGAEANAELAKRIRERWAQRKPKKG